MLCKVVVSTATAGGKSIITDEKDGIIADIKPESLAEKIQFIYKNGELQNKIKNLLEQKDYSKEYDKFRNKWKKLLEG